MNQGQEINQSIVVEITLVFHLVKGAMKKLKTCRFLGIGIYYWGLLMFRGTILVSANG